ncbi:MAG: pentapeptide repeat-containing protein [Elainellaceae cyanobacterium]
MLNSPVVRTFLPALLISSGLFTCLTIPMALQRSKTVRVNIPLVYHGDVPPLFHRERRDIAIRYVGFSILLSVAAGFTSVEVSRKRHVGDPFAFEDSVDGESFGPVPLPTTLSSSHLNTAMDTASRALDAITCRMAPPDTSFQQGSLSQVDLTAVDFNRADLSEADLSGSILAEAQLLQADLRHANLKQAELQQASLQQANCAYASFRSADLKDANLHQASLIGTDLTDADLTGANLSQALYDDTTRFPSGFDAEQSGLYWIGPGAALWGLDLSHANLSGVNLREANLTGVGLAGADLWGTNLAGADLTGANLSGAMLRGASLRGANLSGAVLRYANLTDADLDDADMTDVDLADTVLIGTVLETSNISA